MWPIRTHEHEILTRAVARVNIEGMMLREISHTEGQTRLDSTHVTLHIHRDRKNEVPRGKGGGAGHQSFMGRVSVSPNGNCRDGWRWCLHNVDGLHATELCA